MKDETLGKMVRLILDANETELRVLSRAIGDRSASLRNARSMANIATIGVGDRVRLRNIKPKYLDGTLATVMERRGLKYRIKLDENCDIRAKRRFGMTPTCPATTLEKVED